MSIKFFVVFSIELLWFESSLPLLVGIVVCNGSELSKYAVKLNDNNLVHFDYLSVSYLVSIFFSYTLSFSICECMCVYVCVPDFYCSFFHHDIYTATYLSVRIYAKCIVSMSNVEYIYISSCSISRFLYHQHHHQHYF